MTPHRREEIEAEMYERAANHIQARLDASNWMTGSPVDLWSESLIADFRDKAKRRREQAHGAQQAAARGCSPHPTG